MNAESNVHYLDETPAQVAHERLRQAARNGYDRGFEAGERAGNLGRDRAGLLNVDGRYLEFCVRKEREFRRHGMTEAADAYKACAESSAYNIKAAADSLRKSCLVPITVLGRAPGRRRAARIGGV